MPSSKQRPLTAKRGGHEHDFSVPYPDWEAACFDRAAYFAVVRVSEHDPATGCCPEARLRHFP